MKDSNESRELTVLEEFANERVMTEYGNSIGMNSADLCRVINETIMPGGASFSEFRACMLIAAQYNLNPLLKEVHFAKSKGGGIIPIVGVDGWVTLANANPKYDGHEYEYEWLGEGEERKLISMTCIVYIKGSDRPRRVTEFMDEANTGKGVWQTHPKRMMRNRVTCQGFRMALGIRGIMTQDEFDAMEAQDITPAKPAATDVPWEMSDAPSEAEASQDPAPAAIEHAPAVPFDDIEDAEVVEVNADNGDGFDEDQFLEALCDSLAAAGDDTIIRNEVVHANNEIIARLSQAGRLEAARMING